MAPRRVTVRITLVDFNHYAIWHCMLKLILPLLFAALADCWTDGDGLHSLPFQSGACSNSSALTLAPPHRHPRGPSGRRSGCQATGGGACWSFTKLNSTALIQTQPWCKHPHPPTPSSTASCIWLSFFHWSCLFFLFAPPAKYQYFLKIQGSNLKHAHLNRKTNTRRIWNAPTNRWPRCQCCNLLTVFVMKWERTLKSVYND